MPGCCAGIKVAAASTAGRNPHELTKWFKKDWVDISAPKKGGGYKKFSRTSSERGRSYPMCLPAAKAGSMSKSQIRSAVLRKRSKRQGVGAKPINVATFAKKRQARA